MSTDLDQASETSSLDSLPTPTLPGSIPRMARQPSPPDDPLFDEFWSVYPRKVSKAAARREWHRTTSRRGGVDPERIIAAATRFRDECREKGTDAKYIPHPMSWLRNGRYEDEAASPAAATPAVAIPAARREWRTPEWQTDEQLLATVIRLTADQEHPVSAAEAVIRAVRAQFPAGIPEGFPFVSAERARELAAMPYRDYLLTPEWEARRKAMLKAAGYRCMVCNQDSVSNVHHRTYQRRGFEHPSDLIVLCEDCHMLFHGKRRLAPAPVEPAA